MWGFAIVVPASFLILGVARLVAVLDALAGSRPKRVTPHLAQALGADHLAATDLVLPGGRRLHEMVLGPFGIAVLGDVPPRRGHAATSGPAGRSATTVAAGSRSRTPSQRASRDAERVRGWLASDDRDFLVRVYAAIVTDDPTHRAIPRLRGRADVGAGVVAGGAAGRSAA